MSINPIETAQNVCSKLIKNEVGVSTVKDFPNVTHNCRCMQSSCLTRALANSPRRQFPSPAASTTFPLLVYQIVNPLFPTKICTHHSCAQCLFYYKIKQTLNLRLITFDIAYLDLLFHIKQMFGLKCYAVWNIKAWSLFTVQTVMDEEL